MNQTTAPPRLITLIFLSALSVLPVNMILPSLPAIAEALRTDYALISLSVACYAIATALSELVAGALSDRYGRKPVVLVSVTLFIIASVGCALATNLGIFLLFRAMQASIAACFSVVLVIVKEASGAKKAASTMGYLSAGWALAPMLGPTLGGILDEAFGWRASFIVLAILGVAALVLSVRELRPGLSTARASKASHLASYSRLLSSAHFWAYVLCMACSTATLYIFLSGAPLVTDALVGGSSLWLGIYMGLVPVGFIIGSFLAGRYGARIPLDLTLILGRVLTCLGLVAGLLLSWLGPSHAMTFFGPCLFIGLGNGLTMPAANMGVLSIDDELAGTAAGLAAAMTIGGGALIAAVASVFLSHTTTTSFLLGLMLTSATLALLAGLYPVLVNGAINRIGRPQMKSPIARGPN